MFCPYCRTQLSIEKQPLDKPVTLKEFITEKYPWFKINSYHEANIKQLENCKDFKLYLYGKRQVGLSTLLCLYVIWKIYNGSTLNFTISSFTQHSTDALFDKFTTLLREGMNGHLSYIHYTKNAIAIVSNKSGKETIIQFFNICSPWIMRGTPIDELILDNTDYYTNFKTSEYELFPTVKERIIKATTLENMTVVGTEV
jgi:hypothetical protein